MNSFFGKLLGCILGFFFYGFEGALIGILLGQLYDMQMSDDQPSSWFFGRPRSASQNQQKAFMTGVIVLGAKMAKADGRVTRAEIEAFKRVFQISTQDTAYVGKVFDKARQSVAGFEPYAFQLAQMFAHSPAVLEQILSGLFVIAAADSAGLSQAELRFLQRVAVIFNFDLTDFVRIAARSGVTLPDTSAGSSQQRQNTNAPPRHPLADYFNVLGVSDTATNDEIKASYRALIRKHHPDMLVAAGMAPAFIATAEEKMKRINIAYGEICKHRGIK